jgi:hypothetical protein
MEHGPDRRHHRRFYKVERGDRRVRVGIMDTGVDGTHPDIARNFSTG